MGDGCCCYQSKYKGKDRKRKREYHNVLLYSLVYNVAMTLYGSSCGWLM